MELATADTTLRVMLGVALALSLPAFVAGAVALARTYSSTPSKVLDAAQRSHAEAIAANQVVEALEARVDSLERQQLAFIEDAERVLAAVERKRKQASASAARVAALQGDGESPGGGSPSPNGAIDPTDPIAVQRLARSRGMIP